MTNRTALIWILGGLAAMLLLGRRRSDAPAIGGMGGTDPSFVEFVRRSIEDKSYKKNFIVNVNEIQQERIRRESGNDIALFVIPAHRIRHAYNRHKSEFVNEERLSMIPDLLNFGIARKEFDTSSITGNALRFELRMNGYNNILIMATFEKRSVRRYEMKTFFVNEE